MNLSVDDALRQVAEDIRGGRLDQAAGRCEALLADRPETFGALHMLAVVRAQQGRADEAASIIGKAIAINPRSAQAINDSGVIFLNLGRHDRALEQFKRADALTPDDPQIVFNRGTALRKLARYDEALGCYDRVLELASNHPDTLFIRGYTLMQLGRLSDAVACYDLLLAVQPNHVSGLFNRAGALRSLGRNGEALIAYDHILAMRPNHLDALFNRGLSLYLLRRFEESLACYDAYLARKPDNPDAHSNRGKVLVALNRYDDALASYDRALALEPDHRHALPLKVTLKRYMCDWPDLDAVTDRLVRLTTAGVAHTDPFALLMIADDPVAHAACARRHWEDFQIDPTPPLRPRATAQSGKIRLGYLSTNFLNHAVAFQIAELFELHDRSRFEVLAFSYGADDGSQIRQRIQRACDRFTDLRGMSNAEIVRAVRAQDVDILIEIDGLIGSSRCEVLNYRLAPLQVHYFGYPGPMGTPAVDYAMVDSFVVPAGGDASFMEKLVYLPGCYMMNDRKRDIAPETPSRRDCSLPDEGFVFCSFNNNYKITPPVYDVWMRLMKAVPGSVLWLLADNAWSKENLAREAEARGVDRARILFASRVPHPVHLARQANADLMLDTLPFNGYTTTSDALWMGVPVVSCAGRSFAARVAGSLLTAVGLSDLVVDTLPEYEALARDLATHPDRLAAIRAQLRASCDSAGHFDSDATRRAIERACEMMWARHLAGQPPESFRVA